MQPHYNIDWEAALVFIMHMNHIMYAYILENIIFTHGLADYTL